MRKRGECIIDNRVKFKKGFQKLFVRKIKKNSGLTWKALADSINLSEYTLRVEWQKERSTIPYKIAYSLLKVYPFEEWETIQSKWVEKILPANWGQKSAGGKNKKKIKIPEKSEELAELLGVILGDGHLEEGELTITSEFPYEKNHLDYISEQIKKLFGIDSKIFISYTNKNTIILDCYSSELIKFLKNNSLTVGNKIKNGAHLPSWISEKKEFIYGALRGLLDTDGGIYRKQKRYNRAIIEFQTNSKIISHNIICLLKKINFTPSKSTNKSGFLKRYSFNVRIQNQNELHSFFKLIGSSNPKNIERYKYFIKNGDIPSKKELKGAITNLKESLPFRTQL